MSREIDDPHKRLLTNLLQLQNLIKRDPESYKHEFTIHWKRYQELLDVFQMDPSTFLKEFDDLTSFLAQVSHCYSDELKEYPGLIHEVLQAHGTVLDPTIRMTMVKGLIMLRNKNLIEATSILELFFKLFRCQDKLLRKTIFNYIVQDVKNINAKHKNVRLNTTLQNFMYRMLRDNNATAAKMSLDVMIELYKRNIWKDAKTVNVIVTACTSRVTKILVAALKFFLGKDPTEEEDSDSEDEKQPSQKTAKEIILAHRVGKKSRKRQKKLSRALQQAQKRKKNKQKSEVFDFSALRLIHDPQGFSETLLHRVEHGTENERFEVKLMMIDLISRLIGVHQLQLERFYPFLKRFLQPHQKEVTKLLLFAAQASHDLVPPEDLEQVLKTIADNFISERNSSEVMAVGLNSVREICARCPLAIGETLLQDLAQYKTHKAKAVMMAARSLIQVYRHSNPELLHKKDRGKPTEATKEQKLAYGEVATHEFIPGAETLLKMDQEQQEQEDWESASDDEDMDDDSDGWIDVHHSSDEEEVKEETPQEAEDKKKMAQEVCSTRIMTQEDFRRLQQAQLAKEAGLTTTTKSRKRKRPAHTSQDRSEMPNLGDIENVHKKRAHDKDSRLSTVMAGREGRGKFSGGPQRMNPHASTTNKEKKKNKAFMMIKHKPKLKEKKKRSFRDKQIALRDYLLKQQKKRR